MDVEDAKAAITKALGLIRSLQVVEGSDRDFVEEQLAFALDILSRNTRAERDRTRD